MGPHSSDLRERVADAVDRREGSLRQIARRFSVSLSFVSRLLRLRSQTGSLAPRTHGGGRKPIEVKYPGMMADLERLIADEIAGDPMSATKWVRSSTQKLRDRLRERGYQVSHMTSGGSSGR